LYILSIMYILREGLEMLRGKGSAGVGLGVLLKGCGLFAGFEGSRCVYFPSAVFGGVRNLSGVLRFQAGIRQNCYPKSACS
jgi:hypothetical protein